MESKIANTLHDLKLERDTFITIMSQRKSGKSVLLSNLIHYFLTSAEQRCHFCYLFSTTAKLNKHTNHSYSFLDPRAILSPDPSVINPFVKNLIESQKQTKMKYYVLLVFDDIVVTNVHMSLNARPYLASLVSLTSLASPCHFRHSSAPRQPLASTVRARLHDTSFLLFVTYHTSTPRAGATAPAGITRNTKRYEALEFLATAGRHYSITVVLSSQISNNAISPIIRTNVDYVFWRKLGKLALQNNIFPYMSISEFQDYHQLHDFTLSSTSDYRFVFYNNSTDEASEKIKLVRAQDLPDGFQYKLADAKPKKMSRPMIKW